MASEEDLTGSIDPQKAYEDSYTMRQVGGGVSTSVPKKVVQRKAKEVGIPIEEFIEKYEVVAYYDDFKNADYVVRFRKKKMEE